MARRKLGNDPFERGAAPREPESGQAPDQPAASGKKGKHKRRTPPGPQEPGVTASAPPIEMDSLPPAEAAVADEPIADEPRLAEAEPEHVESPVFAEERELAAGLTEEAAGAEPTEEVAAPEPPAPVSPHRVAARLETSTVPTPADGITPEDAPPPAEEKRSRPRLRLLRFDRPELDRTLAGAFQTVEKLAEKPAAAATEEMRKVVAAISGQLSSAEGRRMAEGLFSRLGLVAAASRAPVAREVDAFGRDARFEQKALDALRPLYQRYFRVEAKGLEHLPEEGPVILVSNRSGALPWDTVMLKCAVAYDHPRQRTVRPLVENFIFHFPFVGVWLNRFGAVRACQENAEALLHAGEAVAVFPEGVQGLGKTFGRRYRLQRFGRGGFVKLAVRTGAPIVPVAIVGAEEAHPLLWRLVKPVAPFGLPFLPVTPTFPLLGPLGLVPLPTKWHIELGPQIRLTREQAADELQVEKLTEDVRSDIQARLDKLLRERRGVFR